MDVKALVINRLKHWPITTETTHIKIVEILSEKYFQQDFISFWDYIQYLYQLNDTNSLIEILICLHLEITLFDTEKALAVTRFISFVTKYSDSTEGDALLFQKLINDAPQIEA